MQSGHHAEPAASNDAMARILRKENKETFDAAKDAIMKRVLLATVQEAIEDLGTPDDIAEQALRQVEEEQAALHHAVAKVKQCLIDEIARRSTDELAEAVAYQALALIGDEHTAILQAVDTLKAQLLETIVQQSLTKIGDEVNTPLAVEKFLQPKPARKSYVKTSVVEARPPASPSRPAPPGTPSSTPQMQRKKAANGYAVEGEALPEVRLSEQAEEAIPDSYYVYGIVANHGLALADALADADIDPPYTPSLMPYQSVAAIVSHLPGTARQGIRQKDIHRVQERILEQINAAGIAALPMYAETTHPSQAYLKKVLARYAEALDTALKNLAGKQEWNVKIYCDSEKVQQAVYARDETIDNFLNQFVETADVWSDAGGEAELEALQAGMDSSLPEVLEAILGNCQRNCHRALDTVSIDHCTAPASDDSVFGNSRMVLNASYLVVEERGEAFRAALENLALDYERLGLVYYIGGPHLPCRFASPEAPTL